MVKCWIIYDEGKTGTLNQCLGLAEALNLSPEIKAVSARFPWSCLPPNLWFSPLTGLTARTRLEPPWPDLVIAGGRVSAAPAASIKRLSQGKTKVVQLLNPHMDSKHFDVVIAPYHDQLQGPNVLQSPGPFHRITPDRLEQEGRKFSTQLDQFPHPRAAILLGGPNKYYKLDQSVVRDILVHLKKLIMEDHYSLLITVSRRTSEDCRALLQRELQGLPVSYWDGEGPNPYFAYLDAADVIMVTSDSVSMTVEAASTGKPVYLYRLPGYSRKFARFHDEMERRGHIRFFSEKLTPYEVISLDVYKEVLSELQKLISV